ncbi:hypothetical protein KPL42_13135 [Clostridium gasigenes]|uniref:hypothetical protein n=1 Tax=Clostridium gasigenes TaxID=94869 RepID=UPI001C0C21B4|nr:hypothetical protein [Clostridium gasigenes]MBU3089435.1 hypothetical protein [Clostridium gasigenes]
MKNTNVSVWKIEESLEEVLVLLQEDYSKFCNELGNYQIDIQEKLLINKWTNSGGQAWEIRKINIEDDEYRYVHCIANMEVNSIPNFGMESTGDKPLPKRIRVKKVSSEVFFIEYMGSIYVITVGSKSNEGRIKSNLMDSTKKREEARWKKIISKNIPEFSFDKSFYYWLLYNKGNEFIFDNNKLKLNDVKGFKSSAERNEIAYKGEGSNIDSEIPLKSLVSMDESLISLYLHIQYNESIEFAFYMDNDGRLEIYEIACGEFRTPNAHMFSREESITYIYFMIIPFLIRKYNEDNNSSEWEINKNNFKKKLSIEIILELMQENSIKIEDLDEDLDEELTVSSS